VARTLDPAAHELRREAFVEAAQRLITVKGYDQMSIQDVLDDLGASRGAFYHYFDSKAALRGAVLDRMVDAATDSVGPIVDDPKLSARAKLQGLFSGIARWKGERTDLLENVMSVWQADENALVREQYRQRTIRRLTPMLVRIVEQGQAEGSFDVADPPSTAKVLATLILGSTDTATALYFERRAGTVTFDDVVRQLTAFATAYERILGIPAGTWPITDRATLRQWFG